jgi:hypothetical protein
MKNINAGDYIEVAGNAHYQWFRGKLLSAEKARDGIRWNITVATSESDTVGESYTVYEGEVKSLVHSD